MQEGAVVTRGVIVTQSIIVTQGAVVTQGVTTYQYKVIMRATLMVCNVPKG